jgi:uncharacterized protein YdhG (YjbR/CyaY superfamily)
MTASNNDIDTYIKGFPKEIRELLIQVRKCIKESAPGAEESIKYGIPTFTLKGNLVHFAGFKGHIGFYPAPSAIIAFKDELSNYKTARGTVQFPLDQPIPFDLIERMVAFRVEESLRKN